MPSGSLTDALRDTLAQFDGSGQPLTTSEVADRLDLGRRSTYDRLDRLVDHGELVTKKVGSNGRVWWRSTATSNDDAAASARAVQQLDDDRDQLELLVEAVEEYAIFVLDPDGRIQTWNPGAERIKGYEREAVLGEHVSIFYTDEDRRNGVPEGNLADAADRGVVEDEGWRVRSDGRRFWAHVTMTAMYDGDGTLRGYAKVTRDMTDRREREQAVRRERDLLERILETSPIGIGVFRPDGSVDRTNARMTDLFGPSVAEAGTHALDDRELRAQDGEGRSFEGRPTGRVVETGEPVSDREIRIEGPDGQGRWLSVDAAPIVDEDGELERVVTTATDVTQRKEQARRLRRRRDELESELDEVLDRISDGFYGLDEHLRFTYLNDRAAALFGLEEPSVVGRDVRNVLPLTDRFEAALLEARNDREPVFLEDYYEPLEAWFENALYPSETGVSVYFRDVTERKAREQELEEYERIVEAVDDGVYVLDQAGRFRRVNEAVASMTGFERSELLGSHAAAVFGEKFDDADAATRRQFEDEASPVASFEEEIHPTADETIVVEGQISRFEVEGGRGRVGVLRDVTDRLERERELERFRTIVETVDEGIYVVDGDGRFTMVNEAYAELTGYRREELLGAHVSRLVDEETAETARAIERELARGERETAKFEADLTTASGAAVRAEATFALLPDGEGGHERIGVVRDVTDRVEREERLERQRERLAALDDLNRVVRDLSEAVIDQSTRGEIERLVCEGLAATESYAFAWIGDVDPRTRTMDVRTEAGVEGYLDDVTISVDPEDPRSAGPTGRAVQTGEMQVTEDVLGDEAYAAWHDHARERGVRSTAAIPMVHEGVLYGVLNVYADRPRAFSRDEGAVIGHLGEMVGHAIAAVERKRALTSDEVVEFEFHIPDVFEAFDVPTAVGRLTLDRSVPVDDGEYLVYGTATDGMLDALDGFVASIPHWRSVQRLGETEAGVTRFELRLGESPVLSTVTALGGYVDRATVEDGDYFMRIHLAPEADARRLVDLVRDEYPMAQLLSRQQITRDADPRIELLDTLAVRLTDRQRAVLEAAFFAGYFEWPRDVSGEDLAESLGVSSPTFHQHLRNAQRKLLDAVLGEGATG